MSECAFFELSPFDLAMASETNAAASAAISSSAQELQSSAGTDVCSEEQKNLLRQLSSFLPDFNQKYVEDPHIDGYCKVLNHIGEHLKTRCLSADDLKLVSGFFTLVSNFSVNRCTDPSVFLNHKIIHDILTNDKDFFIDVFQHTSYKVIALNNGEVRIFNKGKKHKANDITNDIPLSKNRFEVLDEAQSESMDETLALGDDNVPHTEAPGSKTEEQPFTTVNSKKPKKKDPYCIIFETSKNYKTQLDNIKRIAPSCDILFQRNLIKVVLDDENDYRAVQEYVTTNNIPFRTIDNVMAKPVKFVLRGLPANTDIQDIKDSLLVHNIEAIQVANLKNRKDNNSPLPLFLVTLRNTPNIDNLNKITEMNYLKITFKPYNQTGYTMCYRCQRHGHSSMTCKLPQRCLKCGQGHASSSCKIARENFCCPNCNGCHPANYRGCPAHPSNRNKNNSDDNTANSTPTTTQNKKPTTDFVPSPIPKNAWNVDSNSSNKPSTSDTPTPAEAASLKQNSKNKDKSAKNSNVKNSKKSTSNTSNKQSGVVDETSSSSTSGIGELFATITEFMKSFNISDILQLFKNISNIWKTSGGDPLQKLTMSFEAISKYFNSNDSDHGEHP